MQAILRLKEVIARTGRSRSSIYNDIKQHQFPAQIKLGARAVGWLEAEIEDWLLVRIAVSRSANDSTRFAE